MIKNPVEIAVNVESRPEIHLARILLLIHSCGVGKERHIAGITKLAKLDFFLRYPACLQRAMEAAQTTIDLTIDPHDLGSIESKMIRFKYGPWDHRYRYWLSILHSKGLIRLYKEGRTVNIVLTDSGIAVAKDFETSAMFAPFVARCKAIRRLVGGLSASALKDYVYAHFPEIVEMKWGADIKI